jgi:hypothetical protein
MLAFVLYRLLSSWEGFALEKQRPHTVDFTFLGFRDGIGIDGMERSQHE